MLWEAAYRKEALGYSVTRPVESTVPYTEKTLETIMRNLLRRIVALEKAGCATQHSLQAVAEAALVWLGSDDLELLISAYAADRVDRPLTEREAAAKHAFAGALTQQCQWAGLQAIRGFDPMACIRQAIIVGVARRFSQEVLQLASKALSASARGDASNQSELAALQAVNAEHQRLCQLAGLVSAEEFQAFARERSTPKVGDSC